METINKIIEKYRTVLGKDFNIYKNHLYRIYNFMVTLDNDQANYEKYAIACVFHDLGIWTHSFDYLEPSIKLASEYLKENDLEHLSAEISIMIENHHKISVYKGNFSTTVDVFRKADWIDVSMGFLKMGLKSSDYLAIAKKYPNTGFHWFLTKQSLKYFIKNPLNPLPMFKK